MDIATMIIGAVVLSLFILPFWITIKKNSRENGGPLKSLQEQALAHGAQITRSDRSGPWAIGLDEARQRAFFSLSGKNGMEVRTIDLHDCTDVAIVSKYGGHPGGKSATGHPEEIALKFLPAKETKAAEEWSLYSAKDRPQLGNELLLARKWEKLLKEQVGKHRRNTVKGMTAI